MKGYVTNIEAATKENATFRTVLYTDERVQLVVMSIPVGEDIGEEVHHLDQFLRIESGTGTAILDGVSHEIADGSAIIVPTGTLHNLINTSATMPLKLYSLYAPPNHKDGTVHATKADAIADEGEHFDGTTTDS